MEAIDGILRDGSGTMHRLFRRYLRKKQGRMQPSKIAAKMVNRLKSELMDHIPAPLGAALSRFDFDSIGEDGIQGHFTKDWKWEVRLDFYLDGVKSGQWAVLFTLAAAGVAAINQKGGKQGKQDKEGGRLKKKVNLTLTLYAKSLDPFPSEKFKVGEREFTLLEA